jgi:acyl carrier protein
LRHHCITKGLTMLTEQNIRDAIANTVLNFDISSLTNEASFIDAGLDSLDISSLLLELQEHHNLIVPDEDVDKCSSVRATLEYAESQKS